MKSSEEARIREDDFFGDEQGYRPQRVLSFASSVGAVTARRRNTRGAVEVQNPFFDDDFITRAVFPFSSGPGTLTPSFCPVTHQWPANGVPCSL